MTARRRSCFLLLGCLLLLLMPARLFAYDPPARTRLAKVGADMRALTAALERYRVDHGGYPQADTAANLLPPGALTTPNAYIEAPIPDVFKVTVVRNSDGRAFLFYAVPSVLFMLIPLGVMVAMGQLDWAERGLKKGVRTLCVASMVGFPVVILFTTPPDFDAGEYTRPNEDYLRKPRDFHYYTDGRTWFLLHSVGVDGAPEWTPPTSFPMSPAGDPAFSAALAEHTYDPTNGTWSTGDVFRWNR
jgi:hypothetical protein